MQSKKMLRKRDVIDVSYILLFFASLALAFNQIGADLPFAITGLLLIFWAVLISYLIYRRRKVENRLYEALEKMDVDFTQL